MSVRHILVFVVACSTLACEVDTDTGSDPDRIAPIAATSDPQVSVDPTHQACTVDEDCASVYTDCSSCSCDGVHVDFAADYEDALDCSLYDGAVCDYDCDPSYGLEAPRCVSGTCASVPL